MGTEWILGGYSALDRTESGRPFGSTFLKNWG